MLTSQFPTQPPNQNDYREVTSIAYISLFNSHYYANKMKVQNLLNAYTFKCDMIISTRIPENTEKGKYPSVYIRILHELNWIESDLNSIWRITNYSNSIQNSNKSNQINSWFNSIQFKFNSNSIQFNNLIIQFNSMLYCHVNKKKIFFCDTKKNLFTN